MKKPLYIGLGHYKRTGKDSFANYLVAALAQVAPHLRVKKLSLAWKLKQVCHELYAWAGLQGPDFYETEAGGALREVVLTGIGKSPRQIWIDFGTPAVREQVYDRTWIDYVFKTDHQADVILVPDVRFENEATEIKQRGGSLIKVVRPGYGPGPNLPDRQLLGYDGWDWVIGDVGTMESLNAWANEFSWWIAGKAPRPFQSYEGMQRALGVETVEPWEPEPATLQMPTTGLLEITPVLAKALLDVQKAVDCNCFAMSAPAADAEFKNLMDWVKHLHPGLEGDAREGCRKAA